MSETLTGDNALRRIAQGIIAAMLATIGASAVASGDGGVPEWPPGSAPDCTKVKPYDPSQIFTHYSRDQIVRLPEVIVDGVIESYKPDETIGMDSYIPPITVMRVDKVWKGDVAPHVLLSFLRTSPDCEIPPLIGRRIRLGADIDGKNLDLSRMPEMPSALEGKVDDLSAWGEMAMPVRDPALDRLLDAYRAKTEVLRQAAATGGKQARLAYAEHLRVNHETHRAFEIYDALLRENPNDLDLLLVLAVARTTGYYRSDEPEKRLQEVAERAPHTEDWRRKIDHARFAATGKLTSGERNWADLKRTNSVCSSDQGNFDGAVFDRSDFSNCAFRYSRFRTASFRGTDLTGSYFQNSDLTGAQYDCTTKLPDDLDPTVAGMVNVDGSCAKQP